MGVAGLAYLRTGRLGRGCRTPGGVLYRAGHRRRPRRRHPAGSIRSPATADRRQPHPGRRGAVGPDRRLSRDPEHRALVCRCRHLRTVLHDQSRRVPVDAARPRGRRRPHDGECDGDDQLRHRWRGRTGRRGDPHRADRCGEQPRSGRTHVRLVRRVPGYGADASGCTYGGRPDRVDLRSSTGIRLRAVDAGDPRDHRDVHGVQRRRGGSARAPACVCA